MSKIRRHLYPSAAVAAIVAVIAGAPRSDAQFLRHPIQSTVQTLGHLGPIGQAPSLPGVSMPAPVYSTAVPGWNPNPLWQPPRVSPCGNPIVGCAGQTTVYATRPPQGSVSPLGKSPQLRNQRQLSPGQANIPTSPQNKAPTNIATPQYYTGQSNLSVPTTFTNQQPILTLSPGIPNIPAD
jgi:hypothetical protein